MQIFLQYVLIIRLAERWNVVFFNFFFNMRNILAQYFLSKYVF